MTIYPNEFRLFKVIENKRTHAKIYLYHKSICLFKGEIKNISPERFDRLKIFLEELIQINNSKLPIKFGVIEVQKFLEGFK